MAGRPPSPVLVVDANIILSAVLGVRSGQAIARVAEQHELSTSQKAADEVQVIIQQLLSPRPEAIELAKSYLAQIAITPAEAAEMLTAEAALVLRNAVASRNGSTSDAHLLALAWVLDADIWSHDRDFAGTGWTSWSSANLLAHLADEGAENGTEK
jgi:predicted nucleic acid-binding protein